MVSRLKKSCSQKQIDGEDTNMFWGSAKVKVIVSYSDRLPENPHLYLIGGKRSIAGVYQQ